MAHARGCVACHSARLLCALALELWIVWTAGCGVSGDSAEQALDASFRTATARALTATAVAAARTPTPPRGPTATASLHPSLPSPTPTSPIPPSLLTAARAVAVVARILTTVGGQPIQVIGFPAGIERARRLAGAVLLGSGTTATTPGEPCETDSCGIAGTVVERVSAGCPLGGSLCSVCATTASTTVVAQEHQGCRGIGALTTGGIRLQLPAAGLCRSEAPFPTSLTMQFCDFLGSNGDGEVAKSYHAEVNAAPRTGECAFDDVSALLAGSVIVRGFRDSVDQELVLDNTTLAVRVDRFLSTQTCAPTDYVIGLSGPVILADRNASTRVQTVFEDASVGWKRAGAGIEISFDGRVRFDCIGTVAFRTVAPLIAAPDATCPDEGELQLEIGDQIITARFAPQSRILLANGSAAVEFRSCVESTLTTTCTQ